MARRLFLSFGLFFLANMYLFPQQSYVILKHNTINKEVEVLINNKQFTVFHYNSRLEKPVLFPLKTVNGITVTRGFPLETRPSERVDHPHHVGAWFNFGDVNGVDFWNNSYAIPEKDKYKYGTVQVKKVKLEKYNKTDAAIRIEALWVDNSGKALLKEQSLFIFSGDSVKNCVTRNVKLTALVDSVVFNDSKEGMFAVRVAREFELPVAEPVALTDQNGIVGEKRIQDNKLVTGSFLTSENMVDYEAWGTQARWIRLSGIKENDKISLVMFDHPKNISHPAYWHARDYGLFSVNNFGKSHYNPNEKPYAFLLKKGKSIVFKYRLMIYSGIIPEKLEIEEQYNNFLAF
jgi:hypothetical protein